MTFTLFYKTEKIVVHRRLTNNLLFSSAPFIICLIIHSRYPFISTRSLITVQNDTPLQNTNNDRKIRPLMLPFPGAKGSTMLISMDRCIKHLVPNHVNTWITYTGHRLEHQVPNKR